MRRNTKAADQRTILLIHFGLKNQIKAANFPTVLHEKCPPGDTGTLFSSKENKDISCIHARNKIHNNQI